MGRGGVGSPGCFPRQNSVNNSHPQLGTVAWHPCNYTSHLSFRSGRSVYHVSGTAGHSFAFSGRLPSTPLVGATLARSLSVSPEVSTILFYIYNFSAIVLNSLFSLCERALTPNFPVCVPGTIFIMYPVILAKPSVLSFPINLSSCQFCLCKFTIICFHFHTSRHHLSYLIIYTANSPFCNPFKALFLSCNKTSTLLLYSNTLNGN